MTVLTARLQQELERIKPATILIVEPDPAIAGLLRDHLVDYEIQIAANGRDAYALCRQSAPDFILIDTNLSDTTALQLFQQFLPAKFANQIPIFFLGQLDDTREQRMKALEMGVDDYISKPFDIIELQYRVRNALPGRIQNLDLVTGLPGWPAVYNELQLRLQSQKWSLILIHIAYMGAYQDLYGAIAGQRVRRAAATLLYDVVDSLGQPDDFIGVLGEEEFVIITSYERPDHMANLFQQRFISTSHEWYTPLERAGGRLQLLDGGYTPLMTPVTAVVSAASGPFATPLAVIEAAEALRPPVDLPEYTTPPLKAIFASS